MHFVFWRLVTYLVVALFKGGGALAKEAGKGMDKKVADSEAQRRQDEAESRRRAVAVEARREEMRANPEAFDPVFEECRIHKVLGDHEGLRWSFMRWQGVDGVMARVYGKIVFARPIDSLEDAVRTMKAYVLDPNDTKRIDWLPSATETIDGAPVLRSIGDMHGLHWQWVKKNGRLMVAGTKGDKTVACAIADTYSEALRVRDGYVPPGQSPKGGTKAL